MQGMAEENPVQETKAPRSVICKGHILKGVWTQADGTLSFCQSLINNNISNLDC